MAFQSCWRVSVIKTWYLGLCAGGDHNLALCQLQHIYHEYKANLCQSQLYPPVRVLGLAYEDGYRRDC